MRSGLHALKFHGLWPTGWYNYALVNRLQPYSLFLGVNGSATDDEYDHELDADAGIKFKLVESRTDI